mgnify:CR=1 FL=1
MNKDSDSVPYGNYWRNSCWQAPSCNGRLPRMHLRGVVDLNPRQDPSEDAGPLSAEVSLALTLQLPYCHYNVSVRRSMTCDFENYSCREF